MWSDEDSQDETDEKLTQSKLQEFWREQHANVANQQQEETRRPQYARRGRYGNRSRNPYHDVMQHENSTCTVFISNFVFGTTEDDIEDMFISYGPINRIFVHKGKKSQADLNQCYGFITFNHVNDARKAIKALNGQMYKGKALHVTMSKKPFSQEDIDFYKEKKREQQQIQIEQSINDDRNWSSLLEKYNEMQLMDSGEFGALPELSIFLDSLSRLPNKLHPAFKVRDIEFDFSLKDLDSSLLESLADRYKDNLLRPSVCPENQTKSILHAVSPTSIITHSLTAASVGNSTHSLNTAINGFHTASQHSCETKSNPGRDKPQPPGGGGRAAIIACLAKDTEPVVGGRKEY